MCHLALKNMAIYPREKNTESIQERYEAKAAFSVKSLLCEQQK
jgi:hypothetical protein